MGQPAGAAAPGAQLMRRGQPIMSQLSPPPAFLFHHQRLSHPTTASAAPAALTARPVRWRQKLHSSSPVRRLSTPSAFPYGCSSDSAAILTTTGSSRPLSIDSSATSSSGANFESQSEDTNSRGLVASLPSEEAHADYDKLLQGDHIGTRASGGGTGRIGSRRKGRVGVPSKSPEAEVEDRRREPFLQAYVRRYKEEGHQPLDDGETLLAKASNPYGFVLQVAEEANEYLRNNKEESLIRKPILKVISDRINEAYGEGLRDSYINEKDDFSDYEE